MQTPTLTNLTNNFGKTLNLKTIEKLKSLRKKQEPFSTLVKELKAILFVEEWDVVYDSTSEYDDRKRGINPMSDEHIAKVKQKRTAFGVTPLTNAGLAVDNSSTEFCKEVIRKTGNYLEKIERIKHNQKEIVYIDMDNVLVNFQSGIDAISDDERKEYKNRLDDVHGIFSKMKPIKDAIKSFKWLAKHFEVFILSTAPWENPTAWSDKLLWAKNYLGEEAHKRLILSHHKNLLNGQFIIDDRTTNGVNKFNGKHIHFGTTDFNNWKEVINYLKQF